MKTKERKEYCTECGCRLLLGKVGAETVRVPYFAGGYFNSSTQWHHPFTKYDRDTGERNYVLRRYCPNAGFLVTKHLDYTEGKLYEE